LNLITSHNVLPFKNLDSAARPQLKDLQNLVTPEYAGKWKAIGNSLSLSENSLDTIEHGNHHRAENCCNVMWEHWLDTDSSASWNKVFSAIDLPIHNRLVDTMSWTTSSEVILTEVTSLLQGMYMKKRFEVSNDNWPPCPPEMYSSAGLIHYTDKVAIKKVGTSFVEQIHRGKVVSSTSSAERLAAAEQESSYFANCKYTTDIIFEIFPPRSDSKSSLCTILIEGTPGIGKTVLSKEIAFLWANSTILKHIKLLVLILLRDPSVQKLTSFVELAQYICACQKNKTVEVFSDHLMNTSGENVLFIFDGYDELPETLRHKSFIADIINHKVLPCCDVVITSRPTVSAHLHTIAECRIEILGYTNEVRKKYICQALQNNSSKIDKIVEYLQTNPFIDSLCCIPLNMTILMCLCMESMQPLPQTQTEISNQFICMTISRYLRKNENVELNIKSLFQVPENYMKVLKELSHLAFDLLGKDKIIFTTADVPLQSQLLLKNFHDLGLLKAVIYFNCIENREQVLFNFTYASVQEFLAAFYVASLSTAEQEKIIRKNFWSSNYLNMWIMYCGITGGESLALKHFLSGNRFLLFSRFFGAKGIAHQAIDDKIKCLHLFQCFLEGGNMAMCNQVGKLFHNKEIDLSGQILLPKDIHTLGFFLTKYSNKQWEVLNISKCYIEDRGFNMLVTSYLDQLNASLKVLDISNNPISPSSLTDIYKLVLRLKVERLVIMNNNLTDEIISKELLHCTINNLNHNICIPSLTVVNNYGKIDLCLSSYKSFEESLYTYNIEFKVLKELNNAHVFSHVRTLHMWNCSVTSDDVKGLVESNPRLKVSMFHISLPDSEVDDWQKVFHPRIISQYHLDMNFRGNVCYTFKSDNALLIFRECLYFNDFILNTSYKLLSVVQITNCVLTSEMLGNIGVIISGSEQCWTVVSLSHCRIDDDGFHTFCSRATNTAVSIKVLNLSNNYLTSACMHDIVSLLQSCKIDECIFSNNHVSEELFRDALQSEAKTQFYTTCKF